MKVEFEVNVDSHTGIITAIEKLFPLFDRAEIVEILSREEVKKEDLIIAVFEQAKNIEGLKFSLKAKNG